MSNTFFPTSAAALAAYIKYMSMDGMPTSPWELVGNVCAAAVAVYMFIHTLKVMGEQQKNYFAALKEVREEFTKSLKDQNSSHKEAIERAGQLHADAIKEVADKLLESDRRNSEALQEIIIRITSKNDPK